MARPESIDEALRAIRSVLKKEAAIASFHDISSYSLWHFIVKDEEGMGVGSDSCQLTALIKAYHEYVERRCLQQSDADTSNGFACHFSEEEAALAAEREVIERDALLLSWFARHSPTWIPRKNLECLLNSSNKGILLEYEAMGIDVRFGIISKSGESIVLAAAIQGAQFRRPFGFELDAIATDNIATGIASLIRSTGKAITLISLDSERRHEPKIPKQNEIMHPPDHILFYHALENAQDCSWYFEGQSQVIQLTRPNTAISTLIPDFPTAWDVKVARAKVINGQDYFVGRTTDEHINMPRLKKLFGESLVVNYSLHPMG